MSSQLNERSEEPWRFIYLFLANQDHTEVRIVQVTRELLETDPEQFFRRLEVINCWPQPTENDKAAFLSKLLAAEPAEIKSMGDRVENWTAGDTSIDIDYSKMREVDCE